MRIEFSPVVSNDKLVLIKKGNELTVDDEVFDFSQMTEGSTLPEKAITSHKFYGDVTMDNGEIRVTIRLPIPEVCSPEQAFPVPLLNVPDGLVPLPKGLPVESLENTPVEEITE